MSAPMLNPMDPLIEGYLSYLDKVGRKTPRTIVDATVVIVGGPTAGNPFGHVSVATTGSGIYSFGTLTTYDSHTSSGRTRVISGENVCHG
jgi:hypothetical protein